MRTFGSAFAALLDDENVDAFWTLVLDLGGDVGTLYFCDSEDRVDDLASFDGNTYEPLVARWGELAANVDREEKILDVPEVRIEFSNFPLLSTGERISDLLQGAAVETARGTIYLNVRNQTTGTIYQEALFAGVVQSSDAGPVAYDFRRARISLLSLTEYYLNQSALRVITESEFPAIRKSDIGQTVPIALGQVVKSPGRVAKASEKETPTRDSENLSSARLVDYTTLDNAIAESWTVVFDNPDPVKFAGPFDTADVLGGTGTPRQARAQSFQVDSAALLGGVKLRMRWSAASGTIFAAVCDIYSDNAGEPGALLAHTFRNFNPSEATFFDAPFVFSTPLELAAATTYWIVVRAWGNYAGGIVEIHGSSAGGYADGHAKAGTYPASDDYARPASYMWGSSRDAYDFGFELLYADGSFGLYGSITGFDGLGAIDQKFESTSGAIRIDPVNWDGHPADGDRFYFTVDPGSTFVIASESPAESPVKSIDAIYWNDDALGSLSGTILSITNAAVAEAIGTGGAVIGQTVTFSENVLVKKITIKLKKTGGPEGGVQVVVSRANLAGNAPDDAASSQIARSEIDVSEITESWQDLEAELDRPFVMLANVAYAITLGNPSGGAPGNEILSGTDDTNSYADGNRYYRNNATPAWTPSGTKDLCLTIVAASVTLEESADDGTGALVAKASFDVDIPDDVVVSFDLSGWYDPAGAYTGTAGALIVRPDAVVHRLLRWWGVAEAEIDLADSFAQAAAQYGGLYRFDGVAQDDVTRKALLLQLAFESRSALGWFGSLAKWSYLKVGLETVDATIYKTDIVPEGMIPNLTVRRTPTTKLINFVDIRYKRRPLEDRALSSYDQIANAQNTTSINGVVGDGSDAFGKREHPEMFMCDFVRDDALATDLALYYAERLGLPRRIGEAVTPITLAALEADDAVNFDLRS